MSKQLRPIEVTGLIAILGLLVIPNICSASLAGTDNASATAYSDGWATGDNGFITGSGAFGAWTLTPSNPIGGFAGVFIGDSRNLASGLTGADINSSGVSFGMYANGNQPVQLDALRSFSSPLSVGQTFSIDLAVNYRNGIKGIDLRNDGTNATIFNFNVANDDYVVQNAATGNGSIGNSYSSNTAFNLSFTQTSATAGTWQITRSGGVSDSDTGTYTGLAASFKLYVGNTGGGAESDLYANNLSLSAVPETNQVIALALVSLLCGTVCWRRSLRVKVA